MRFVGHETGVVEARRQQVVVVSFDQLDEAFDFLVVLVDAVARVRILLGIGGAYCQKQEQRE